MLTETIKEITKTAHNRPTLWFDKDGVLAKYDYSIYMAETGCTPPWLTKNAHVYKNLQANKKMIKAFRTMYANTQDYPLHLWPYEIKVLTGVSNSVTLSEQVIDSWKWMKKKVPGFRERDFYAVAVAKQEIPVMLRRTITPMDILIDDYNNNLKTWKDAGGIAVKALNGINSRNNDYINLNIHSSTAEEICRFLENLIELVKKETDLSAMPADYIEAQCQKGQAIKQMKEGTTDE